MEETILKVAKIIEKWVTIQMGRKNLINNSPSVSYILEEVMSYPGTRSIIGDMVGEVFIRSIFTAYNLLTGDDETTALEKSKSISDISIIERESEEYNLKEECSLCGGDGEVSCQECNEEGEDSEGNTCENCWGHGFEECPECEGSGEILNEDEEVIDVTYFTIVTQNNDLVSEINSNIDTADNEIKGFEYIIQRYMGEILRIDVIHDTIDFDVEWGTHNGVDYKLENIIITPFYKYKINRKGEITGL